MSHSARRLASTVLTDRFNWQNSVPPPAPRVPLVFQELSRSGRAAVDTRQEFEARELHLPSVAEERVQAIEQEAFAKGYRDGQRAAAEELERQREEGATQLAWTLAEIEGMRDRLMRRSDRELIHLALAIGERIVRRELKSEPELMLAMVRAAIARLGDRTTAIVHLHPDDHEAILRVWQARGATFELTADQSIQRGGCLIRSTLGVIDAGVDAQIRELSRAFFSDELSEEAEDGPVAQY